MKMLNSILKIDLKLINMDDKKMNNTPALSGIADKERRNISKGNQAVLVSGGCPGMA